MLRAALVLALVGAADVGLACDLARRVSREATLCVTANGTEATVSVTPARRVRLSAEFGVTVERCVRRSEPCAPIAATTPADGYLPAPTLLVIPRVAGTYRLVYGACDDVREVCIPGEIDFILR